MITPRRTRLVRVPDLQAFHRAIVHALPRGIEAVRDCAVIVPTRGAAEELRRTIENAALAADEDAAAAVVIPELLTRDQFYVRLRERMVGAPALLSEFAREVLLRRAARDASAPSAGDEGRRRLAVVTFSSIRSF